MQGRRQNSQKRKEPERKENNQRKKGKEPERGRKHTVTMGKSTKRSPRTVSSLLNVMTLGRLVYLRVELLLCSSVAVLTVVSCLTVDGISPFISLFHIGTWCTPILERLWCSPLILTVMILWTSVPGWNISKMLIIR